MSNTTRSMDDAQVSRKEISLLRLLVLSNRRESGANQTGHTNSA